MMAAGNLCSVSAMENSEMAGKQKTDPTAIQSRIISWGLLAAAFLLGTLAIPALGGVLQRLWPASKIERTHRQVLQGVHELGDLVALSATMKDIQTMVEEPHWYKARQKKLALICEFELEHRFDLTKAKMASASTGRLTVELPPCRVKTGISNVEVYDEQDGVIEIPLSGGFRVEAYRDRITTEERNKMIQDAKRAAEAAALKMDSQMLSRAEQSAKRTLQALARALGVNEEVEVVFRDRSENKVEQDDK
jgi:hypothetical protein